MIQSLGLVNTPLGFVALVAAFQTLHGAHKAELVVCVHWPDESNRITNEISAVVETLAKGFPFVRAIVRLGANELLGQSVVELKSRLPGHTFEPKEIYYSHDWAGPAGAELVAAFPNAERICYGDGLGMIYDIAIMSRFYTPADGETWRRLLRGYLPRFLADFIRRFRSSSSRSRRPHKAVLALPVIDHHDNLQGVELIVTDRMALDDTVNRCIKATTDLQSYIAELLQSAPTDGSPVLMLLENFSGARLIDPESELRMYEEIVRRNVPCGSTVFIKEHPGQDEIRSSELARTLRSEYEIIKLDSRFERMPIELWPDLVRRCRVISAGYPAVSLKYLYDIDVIQPLDRKFCELWFGREAVRYLCDYSHSLYSEPLVRLSSWDQKSLLWQRI